MIKIKLNSEDKEIEENCSINDFLQKNGLNNSNLAIAVNDSVIPKSEWNTKIIANGDKILLIKAAYGG